MLETQRVLDYLADVASLGTGPSVTLEGLPQQWEVPLAEMRKGILDEALARAVQAAFSAAFPHDIAGSKPVDVVVELVRVREAGTASRGVALLVLPASVDSLGHVAVREGGRATIPFERLSGNGSTSRALCVCDRDAYRAHQLAMASLPDDGSWDNAVSRAFDLFHAVSVLTEETLAARGLELVEDVCVMALCDHPSLANPAASILRRASRRCAVRGEAALGGPARLLLGTSVEDAEKDEEKAEAPAAPHSGLEDGSDDDAGLDALDLETLPDDQLLSHKMLSGLVEHLDALTSCDRAAWATAACQGPGDVLVVSAPKGSHAGSLALATMANRYTEAALRGDEAPRLACVGSPASLASLMDALAERPKLGLTALRTRWLPRIAYGAGRAASAAGEAREDRRLVLGSLAALTTLVVADGETFSATRSSALVEHLGQAADGEAARYADAWYVSQAALHYLDCASSFLGARVRELDEAAELLSERLRLVDQRRCELVDAYANLVRAAAHMGRRDQIVAEVGELRRAHSYVRERLAFWDDVARLNPPRRSLMGLGQADQAELVERNRTPDEPFAEGATLLAEVCERYRTELGRIESEIDRRRGESAMLARRVRAASPAGAQASELIAQLVELSGLGAEEAERLESVMDGHDTSFDYLDRMLDLTVRPQEFWLALHVFEARWLMARGRDGGSGPWQAGELCPFTLMSYDVALGRMGENESDKPDLLVVLDAHELRAYEGLALLAGARQAMVVGSQALLRPAAAFGTTSGLLHAQASVGEQGAEELRERALLASGPHTLLSFACARAKASEQGVQGFAFAQLTDVADTCVEVADLRCALCADERFEALGAAATSEAQTRRVARMLAPLSHVLVPDSAWEQVGGSRRNAGEAQAQVRWLANHADELAEVAALGQAVRPVLVSSAYEAQVELVSSLLAKREDLAGLVEVRWLREVAHGTWPVVLLSATVGPEALEEDCADGVARTLGAAASLARDALVLFCGGAWPKSPHAAAGSFMRRSLRVGRLFSVAHNPLAEAGAGLRSKPLSLTALLKRMAKRGEIAQVPPTPEVNAALARVGLIERVRDEAGNAGWRPTAAGREAGILATTDREGRPFCAYAASAIPVVASIVAASFEG